MWTEETGNSNRACSCGLTEKERPGLVPLLDGELRFCSVSALQDWAQTQTKLPLGCGESGPDRCRVGAGRILRQGVRALLEGRWKEPLATMLSSSKQQGKVLLLTAVFAGTAEGSAKSLTQSHGKGATHKRQNGNRHLSTRTEQDTLCWHRHTSCV